MQQHIQKDIHLQKYSLTYRKHFSFFNITDSCSVHLYSDRRLADGNVHCAGSATYQIFLG